MSTADGQVAGTTQILDNGPVEDLWNLVVMSEGYTSAEVGPTSTGKFARDAQTIVDKMLATPPYDRFRRAINVFRVDVISDEAGVDDLCATPPTNVRTYFDAFRCPGGDPDLARRIDIDLGTAQAVATAQVPHWNAALVIANITDYGGSGGPVAVCSLDPRAHHIALHEIGHSAFKLADEYQSERGCHAGVEEHHPTTVEPDQPNVTLDSQARGKWLDLVAPTTALPTTRNPDCAHCDDRPSPVPDGTIGAFEGAHLFHCDAYRPAYDCRMGNHVDHAFCDVCQRVISRRLATHMPQTNVVAAMLVDPAASNDFRNAVAGGDFVAAMSAVVRLPHWLGMLMFPRDASSATSPDEVTEIRQRRLAWFPSPAVAHATYFSRAGDSTAGTAAVRDARGLAASRACTSDPGGAGSTAQSFDVGEAVFDVARAAGVTERDIVVLDLDFEVAVLALDLPSQILRYRESIREQHFLSAMSAVVEPLHRLGTLVFTPEASAPVPPTALQAIADGVTSAFPGSIFAIASYLTLDGDPAAGTPATRDARRKALEHAMSTADGLGFSLPVRPAAASISLPRAAFDVANAGGVTHTQIMVVQLIPPLEIVDVDSGDPRNSFNISGNNLILQPGERPGVTFVLTDKHFDDRHPPRIVATGSCEIFGQPAPDLVTVVVRELEGLQGEFILELNVSRPDGAEASGEQRLVLI